MHFLGLAGMPRRVPDYPDAYSFLNSVASLGSFVTIIAVIVFFFLVFFCLVDVVFLVENKFLLGGFLCYCSVSKFTSLVWSGFNVCYLRYFRFFFYEKVRA